MGQENRPTGQENRPTGQENPPTGQERGALHRPVDKATLIAGSRKIGEMYVKKTAEDVTKNVDAENRPTATLTVALENAYPVKLPKPLLSSLAQS